MNVKKAEKQIPKAIWETYSSFANTIGGIILLGVSEHTEETEPDKRFEITGIDNAWKKENWCQPCLVENTDLRLVELTHSMVSLISEKCHNALHDIYENDYISLTKRNN